MDPNIPAATLPTESPTKTLLIVALFVAVAIIFAIGGFFLGRKTAPVAPTAAAPVTTTTPPAANYQNPFDQTYENPFQ
ncbi:hypothetical protein HY440_02655 [Candidatus Microgenomates bacterium]|nr:hypothetical protein [Candidatus Microgenomates bacterium]